MSVQLWRVARGKVVHKTKKCAHEKARKRRVIATSEEYARAAELPFCAFCGGENVTLRRR